MRSCLNFRKIKENLITKGEFKLLKTRNDKIFAYSITKDNEELIVIGSLDEKEKQYIEIYEANIYGYNITKGNK